MKHVTTMTTTGARVSLAPRPADTGPGHRLWLAAVCLLAWLGTPCGVAAQTAADREEAAARGYDGILAAGHFAVAWRLDEASADEIRALLAVAEPLFDRISTIVGPERTPTEPVFLVLAGYGQAADGSWRFPNVDERGRVILFRYGDGVMSYRQEIAHELVHAFRRHAGYWLSGFLEEGFAEAMAMEVDPDEVGFPRYGYPLTVAAGHLLERGEYLPLVDVRARHDEVGRRCQLQAYLERAAFFDYLKRKGGLDALLRLVCRGSAPTDADYVELFGSRFADLVSDWEDTLLSAYRNTQGAAEMAVRFRAEPPIASRPVCAP